MSIQDLGRKLFFIHCISLWKQRPGLLCTSWVADLTSWFTHRVSQHPGYGGSLTLGLWSFQAWCMQDAQSTPCSSCCRLALLSHPSKCWYCYHMIVQWLWTPAFVAFLSLWRACSLVIFFFIITAAQWNKYYCFYTHFSDWDTEA